MDRETLEKFKPLKNALLETEGLTGDSRSKLMNLLHDLEVQYEIDHKHTLTSMEVVKNKVEELEGQHPELTKTIQNLCTHLSALGL